jgi:HD superfamily phosphohydrolase
MTVRSLDGALATRTRHIDVWDGCAHPMTQAEELVVASPPFQRLRRLRQMGLAFHAFPNAENTRASHSFGVAYWSATYLDALRAASDRPTRAALAEADASLGALSLEVVLRLFGLLHDIDLLPLGHTLRYQSGLFCEEAGHPRLAACVAGVKASAGEEPGEFGLHLDAAAAALAGEDSPHARLMTELVNSGLGADLVDFALRDSFAITRPQAFHHDLAGALRLVPAGDGWGLALDVSDPATAAAPVAVADDLYRARFEVFAASVFHPVKLAADAMLDLVLRRLGPEACVRLLPEHELLSMGDDQLMDRLTDAEAAVARRMGVDSVCAALRAGRLHVEAWRTDDLAAFRSKSRAGSGRALDLEASWRDGAEGALAAHLPWAEPGDVIVAVSPPTMQAKPANARFVDGGGEVFTLAQAPERGYRTQAGETARRYETLWSLRVYVAPPRRHQADEVAAAAASLFGGEG